MLILKQVDVSCSNCTYYLKEMFNSINGQIQLKLLKNLVCENVGQ